jgi:HSP20 family protein
MTLVRLYPVRRFNHVAEEVDRALDRFFGDAANTNSGNGVSSRWSPNVDIRETKDSFVLTFELPGIGKDDIDIHFENGLLKVEGERKQEEVTDGVNLLREERRFGKFYRSFKVNTRVQSDKIEADYKNGLLTINLPKAEEIKPKEIKVKIGK